MSLLKNKKKAALLIGSVLLIVFTVFGALKYAYQPHKTIDQRKIAFIGTASEILNKVQKAPNEWQDVVVEISGEVTATTPQSITLNNGVFCQFKNINKTYIPKSKTITLKGRIIGYDDLLEELKLDQTILLLK